MKRSLYAERRESARLRETPADQPVLTVAQALAKAAAEHQPRTNPMTTATTKAGGAVLPVVGYSDIRALKMNVDDGYPYEYLTLNPTHKRAEPLTLHAPAQATIDELRAEVERLTRERDAAFAMSRCECSPDECCANLVALKAKQIDVDAVMRLAENMMRASRAIGNEGPKYETAREALRAALTRAAA